MADEFVRVRLLKIAGADLNLFEFDYDLTWVAFFLNADERVYGRFGGRDASGPDGRLSPKGLKFAMQSALAMHRQPPTEKTSLRSGKQLLAEEYPAAKRMRRGECIHCHQVYEFRRDAEKAAGMFQRDGLWVYPLPENIGLTLERDQGNRLKSVATGSAADRIGLRPGDTLTSVNRLSIASFADFQYALHRAPAQGRMPITWQHNGGSRTADIELAAGWRKTNITWRPSMLDILPALSLFGDDLSTSAKKALGLTEKRLAFRQDKTVHADARAAGVHSGDIVIGIDSQALEMTVLEFLAHVRRNHVAGDRITLNILRDGQRLDLPLVLK